MMNPGLTRYLTNSVLPTYYVRESRALGIGCLKFASIFFRYIRSRMGIMRLLTIGPRRHHCLVHHFLESRNPPLGLPKRTNGYLNIPA